MRVLVYTGSPGIEGETMGSQGLHALEFALRVQDLAEAEVYAISTNEAHLGEALAIGAGKGCLLNTEPSVSGFSELLDRLGPVQLIIGFPQEAAAVLDLPLLTSADRPIALTEDTLTVRTETRHKGETVRVNLPAAISAGINTTRLPSYRRMKQLTGAEITKLHIKNAADQPADEHALPQDPDPRIEILDVRIKDSQTDLRDAEIIVAVGRGIGSQANIVHAEALADLLGAVLGCTRPLTELGWFSADRQIGVSGRKVAPKHLITIGVSGAIQFELGIKEAEIIIAINNDEKAPIFKMANYKHVGDWKDILPRIIDILKQGGSFHGLSRA